MKNTTYRPRRSPEQWQVLVDRQADSGLSALRFCKEHDISYPSFTQWRKRLSSTAAVDAATPAKPTFIELTKTEQHAPVHSPAQGNWLIELELGAGVTLRIAKNSP